jgi:16S rRNA (cytidine1402-2'-O)-methyltransferase
MEKGRFIVCGSHNGDIRDVPSRALEVLRNIEYVFCQDFESFSYIIKCHNIQPPPFLQEITESNPTGNRKVLNKMEEILKILESGKDVAFISQHGMPGFAGPGTNIVGFMHEKNIKVVIIPGSDVVGISLAAAGMDTSATTVIFDEFMDKPEEVIKEKMSQLARINAVTVLIDFGERMPNLIRIAEDTFGGNRFAALCSKIGLDEQKVVRGKLSTLISKIADPEIFAFCSLVISSEESPISNT